MACPGSIASVRTTSQRIYLPGIDCWKMSVFIAFNLTYLLLTLNIKSALGINVT